MQIFLCWSGKSSLAIAQAMHIFLGDTIQELKPFLSSEDIRKGGRWNNEIGTKLAECNFGILCTTKDNLEARWMLFEAGALSKLPASSVTALLAGIQSTDVKEPLSQFQHTGISRAEIFKLLEDINALLPDGKRLEPVRLKRAFENNWPALEKGIEEALKLKVDTTATAPARSAASMIAETLELVRELKRGADVARLVATLQALPPGGGYGAGGPLYAGGLNPNMGALSSVLPSPTKELPTGPIGPLASIPLGDLLAPGGPPSAPTEPQRTLYGARRRPRRKPQT
jgi:hypothetical protein